MAKSTISTFQLFERFPNQESARVYFESRLWPVGPVCPVCKGQAGVVSTKRIGYYRCNPCREVFTVRTGTVMERSRIPLHKWLYAMYLLVTARKGISSLQLAKQIGVTQKSAWFMLHRLREACGGKNLTKLKGIIEIDETFVGGLEGNKHENKKLHAGRGPVSTNSIESVWAVLKRGIMGVYHKVSVKHLGRYVDEFTFRLNEGNVKVHTLDRLDSFVDGMADKRLTYARLIQ